MINPINNNNNNSERLNSHHSASTSTNNGMSDVYSAPQNLDNSSIIVETADYDEGDWKSVTGRIGRIQFLAYSMFWILFLIPLAIVLIVFASGLIMAFAMGGSVAGAGGSMIVGLLVILCMLAPLVYISIILPRRRLQDLNQPAWWLIIPVISIFMPSLGEASGFGILSFFPIINLLFQIGLTVLPGTPDINNYGLPPKPYTKVQFIVAMIMLFLYTVGTIAALSAPSMLDPSLMSQDAEDDMSVEEMIAKMEEEMSAQAQSANEDEQGDIDNQINWESDPDATTTVFTDDDPNFQVAIDEALNKTGSDEDMSFEEFMQEDTLIFVEEPSENNK